MNSNDGDKIGIDLCPHKSRSLPFPPPKDGLPYQTIHEAAEYCNLVQTGGQNDFQPAAFYRDSSQDDQPTVQKETLDKWLDISKAKTVEFWGIIACFALESHSWPAAPSTHLLCRLARP